MVVKKIYIKPLITKVDLDLSITLIMKSHVKPPKPRGGGNNQPAAPFESPFGDKPFS